MQAKANNPLDSQFPDIVSKPGNILPSIFSGVKQEDFEI
jgi:hypothetical protein